MNYKITRLGALLTLACFCSVMPTQVSAGSGRPLDSVTGCPKDGRNSALFAVLLDTTDSLVPVAQEIVLKKLEQFAEDLPRYGKLEVYVVRSSSHSLIEPLLQVCNPGRASDTNEWTGNTRLMEKRWRAKFMDPLNKSLEVALSSSVSAKQSPIMEEIQQVSVQAFFETSPKMPKRLAIVSDMLQNSPVLNQYRQPETFEVFQNQPTFVRVRPELKDVEVTILYVHRPSNSNRQGKRHVEFWQSFFIISGARLQEVMSVGG